MYSAPYLICHMSFGLPGAGDVQCTLPSLSHEFPSAWGRWCTVHRTWFVTWVSICLGQVMYSAPYLVCHMSFNLPGAGDVQCTLPSLSHGFQSAWGRWCTVHLTWFVTWVSICLGQVMYSAPYLVCHMSFHLPGAGDVQCTVPGLSHEFQSAWGRWCTVHLT